MSRYSGARAAVGLSRATARGTTRGARAGGVAVQQSFDAFAARRGVLGPGSRVHNDATGYYDFRATARQRELPRLDGSAFFPIGRFVDPRSGRRGREIALPAGVIAQHTLLVGPSQAGKTGSIIVPWIAAGLMADYAVIAADVKGDLMPQIGAELSAAGVSGMRAARLDYRTSSSIGWASVRELIDERRLAAAAVALIGRQRPNDAQPFFWQRDVRLMSGLLATAHASRRPVTATELLAAAHDRYALEAYVNAYGASRARMLLHDALTADLFDYPKVMSGVVNALDPLAIPEIDAITGSDRLRLDHALAGPGLVTFGAPMGDGRLDGFAALVLSLLSQRLHARHGTPSYPLLLVVDEAARLVDRVDFEELLSTAAAANVSIVLAIQDLGQLPEGRVRNGVEANCQTMITMRGVGPATAESVSKRLGTRPEIEISTQHDPFRLQPSMSRRHLRIPVLDTREVQDLPFGPYCGLVHSRPFAMKPFVVDMTRTLTPMR